MLVLSQNSSSCYFDSTPSGDDRQRLPKEQLRTFWFEMNKHRTAAEILGGEAD
jgi:hypothetical protein